MIRLKVMGYIYTRMAQNMKGIGRMIYKMDMELKFGNSLNETYLLGEMGANMKDSIRKARNLIKVDINGQTEVSMWDNGSIIKFVVLESTNGLMVGNTKGNGRTIKCMGKVYIHGMTEENMMENIVLIKSTDSEYILGQMEESTRDFG